MNRINTLAALLAALLSCSMIGSARADESERIWSLPGQQVPALPQPPAAAPAYPGTLMQNLQQGQPAQGYSAPAWQQPQQWPGQQPWGQPWGGQYAPGYAPGGQAPSWPQPQAPSWPQTTQPAPTAKPADDELKRLREQVIEQEDELNRANEILATQYAQINEAYARIKQLRRGEVELQEARARIEQMRTTETGLQECRSRIEQLHAELDAQSATATEQTDKIDYLTRMQNSVRTQIAEMVDAHRAADALLEQQQQLINDYQAQGRQLATERSQLRDTLLRLNEQVNALQSELMRALNDTLRNRPETP